MQPDHDPDDLDATISHLLVATDHGHAPKMVDNMFDLMPLHAGMRNPIDTVCASNHDARPHGWYTAELPPARLAA